MGHDIYLASHFVIQPLLASYQFLRAKGVATKFASSATTQLELSRTAKHLLDSYLANLPEPTAFFLPNRDFALRPFALGVHSCVISKSYYKRVATHWTPSGHSFLATRFIFRFMCHLCHVWKQLSTTNVCAELHTPQAMSMDAMMSTITPVIVYTAMWLSHR